MKYLEVIFAILSCIFIVFFACVGAIFMILYYGCVVLPLLCFAFLIVFIDYLWSKFK
jgi:uncharacterized membrane protein